MHQPVRIIICLWRLPSLLTIIEVEQTLFRGNTIFTKAVELCMSRFGKPFLEASIGKVLRRLFTEKISIEVDPMQSGKGSKVVERNVERLVYWCQEFWNQIYSVRTACPKFVCLVISGLDFLLTNKLSSELRILFETIRKLVEQRYRNDRVDHLNNKLRWQSVSAFCFLRFIVPAILNPHLFGLCSGKSLSSGVLLYFHIKSNQVFPVVLWKEVSHWLPKLFRA